MEPEAFEDELPVRIFVTETPRVAGFVWNANDAFRLRRRHRIVGTFVGCLSKEPRQEQFLGLPLFLMPEEIDLIVSQGFGKTFTCPALREPPGPQMKDVCKSFYDNSFNDQIKVYRQLRKEEILRRANQIVEGRSKRPKVKCELEDENVQLKTSPTPNGTSNVQETQEVQNSDSTMIEEAIINANLTNQDADNWREIVEEEFSRIKNIPKHQEILQIFNAHPWLSSDQMVPFDWFNLSPTKGTLSSQIFMHLWKNNYYLTSGEKFGGSFLVYFGDPCYYHALYVVVCSSLKELDAMKERDFVCRSRLGTAVKKSVMLGYFDQNNDVKFKILRRLKSTKRVKYNS